MPANRRTITLFSIAAIIIAVAVAVNWPSGDEEWKPSRLTMAALDGLQPGPESDQRLLEHLRAIAGMEVADWKELPEPAQPLFATLWAEEVQRTGSWAQMTELDPAELRGPGLAEIADAYGELGQDATAAAVRRLDDAFQRDRAAAQAWIAGGAKPPRPLPRATEAAARAAFARAGAARTARLDAARASAKALGIR